MSNGTILFGSNVEHLSRFAVSTPKPDFSGAWTTLELQPDIFAPQRFTVGVVVQAPGERLHFKLLDDFKKFERLYHERFRQKSARELLAYAESALRQAAQTKTAIPEVVFETNCLMLDSPKFTSGSDWEATVERLFSEVVVMARTERRKPGEFQSIDTPGARELVNAELKKIAQMDFDRIAQPEKQGILLEFEGIHHWLDLNLLTKTGCGSVTSAVYKTAQSVEINMLRASRDLTTYSRIRKLDDVGLFLLTPDPGALEPKEFKHIEAVIDEHEWKLERDGFRVISLPSPAELANEIYEWAKPALV